MVYSRSDGDRFEIRCKYGCAIKCGADGCNMRATPETVSNFTMPRFANYSAEELRCDTHRKPRPVKLHELSFIIIGAVTSGMLCGEEMGQHHCTDDFKHMYYPMARTILMTYDPHNPNMDLLDALM
jgi:hypothetical protein